jgi:nitroreductase
VAVCHLPAEQASPVGGAMELASTCWSASTCHESADRRRGVVVRRLGTSARVIRAGWQWAGTWQRIDTGRMADSARRASQSGSFGPALSACLRAATAAPSIHNSQPWLFRPRRTGVDVLVDRRRRLAVADPDGREMHVSVGAAVFNLRVAMLAAGSQPLVWLLPDPREPDLAATVVAGPAVPVPADVRALADAIPRRQTNRRPFWSMPVPDAVLDAMIAAARAEGACLVVVDSATRSRVLDLVRDADRRQRSDPRYRAELEKWTGPGRADGVPPQVYGPRPELAALPLRDFDLAHNTNGRVARFEPLPTLAVLYTAGDGRQDWLQAGQALERVLLTATVHRLATTPLTQAVEVPELRTLFDAPDERRVVQSIIRLGYAGAVPRTPRRPLADVLVPSHRR